MVFSKKIEEKVKKESNQNGIIFILHGTVSERRISTFFNLRVFEWAFYFPLRGFFSVEMGKSSDFLFCNPIVQAVFLIFAGYFLEERGQKFQVGDFGIIFQWL